MRVLLVAATQQEVGLLISDFRLTVLRASPFSISELDVANIYSLTTHNLQLTTVITGVGMVATGFSLGKHLAVNQYDLAINLGIAGSFDRSIALGEVVEIIEDSFSELGAEDGDAFLPIDQLGFGESTFKASSRLANFGNFNLKQTVAITVNTVHGNDKSIQYLTDRIQPQLENMEGAAFFYACKQAGIPCLQIRAVSNYVEKRNRGNWQIGLAIKNLNTFAAELIRQLQVVS
ncbi:MAG: mqnB [Mucilaginibacter sp.]|nr:mqnB [Mucilaginibacter sp.]